MSIPTTNAPGIVDMEDAEHTADRLEWEKSELHELWEDAVDSQSNFEVEQGSKLYSEIFDVLERKMLEVVDNLEDSRYLEVYPDSVEEQHTPKRYLSEAKRAFEDLRQIMYGDGGRVDAFLGLVDDAEDARAELVETVDSVLDELERGIEWSEQSIENYPFNQASPGNPQAYAD